MQASRSKPPVPCKRAAVYRRPAKHAAQQSKVRRSPADAGLIRRMAADGPDVAAAFGNGLAMMRLLVGDGVPVVIDEHTGAGVTFHAGTTGVRGILRAGRPAPAWQIDTIDVGIIIPSAYVANLAEPAVDFLRHGIDEMPGERPLTVSAQTAELAAELRRAADVIQQIDRDGSIVMTAFTYDRALYFMPATRGPFDTPFLKVSHPADRASGQPGVGQVPAHHLYAFQGYLPDAQLRAIRALLEQEGEASRRTPMLRLERTDCGPKGRGSARQGALREVVIVRLPGCTGRPDYEARSFVVEPTGEVWRSAGDGYVFGDQGHPHWRTEAIANNFGVTLDPHLVAVTPQVSAQQNAAVARILDAAAALSREAARSAKQAVAVAAAVFPGRVLELAQNPDGTLFFGPRSEMNPRDTGASYVSISAGGEIGWAAGDKAVATALLAGFAARNRTSAAATAAMQRAVESAAYSTSGLYQQPHAAYAETHPTRRFVSWARAQSGVSVFAIDPAGVPVRSYGEKAPPHPIGPLLAVVPSKRDEPAAIPWAPLPPT